MEANARLLEEVGHGGAPTLEVDGQLSWGQDRIDHLEDYLEAQGLKK